MRDSIEESVHSLGSRKGEDDSFEDAIFAFTEEELDEARHAPTKAVTSLPPMLGYASTALIIVNRMVGTGIFVTPSTLAQRTESIAASLSLWAAGGFVAVCGAQVFAEFGLSVPIVPIENDRKEWVPRNGGEKNYIEYFYERPRLLATCLYGIPFVLMANVAGNTLVFAESVLSADATNPEYEPNTWAVRGVAIGVATFACSLHAIWRKAGIYVNNTFGALKIAMLLTMFIVGALYAGGQLGGDSDVAATNLDISTSNQPSSGHLRGSVYGYAQGYLGVMFAFGGFHQANYIMGEVKHCKQRFRVTTITTVAFVAVLFFLVNLAYDFVVPKDAQVGDGHDKYSVAATFFHKTFGGDGRKIQSSLLAFSSLGNIIVQTFTAARVKQEIAKEGIIPFARFFSKNYSLTPKWLRTKKEKGSEDTPAAAFFLHWVTVLILILATVPAKDDSYRLLVNIYSFIVNAVFGSLVGLSLLLLRFDKGSGWAKTSATKSAWLSISTATIYTAANMFPLVAIWIPPSQDDSSFFPTIDKDNNIWYLVGVIAVPVIAFAFIWWISLRYLIPVITGKELKTDRVSDFISDHGNWVIWNEVVSINWKPVRKAVD